MNNENVTSNLLAELLKMFLLSFKLEIFGPIGTILGCNGLKEDNLKINKHVLSSNKKRLNLISLTNYNPHWKPPTFKKNLNDINHRKNQQTNLPGLQIILGESLRDDCLDLFRIDER